MLSADAISTLIAAVYDASVDPRLWSDFLEGLTAALAGTCAQLLHFDLDHPSGGIDVAFRLDPEARRGYDGHFSRQDPWVAAASAGGGLTTGSVHNGEALVPHRRMIKSEYYGDFARHFDLTRSLAGVITFETSRMACVSAVRGDRDEPFDDADERLLRILLPHLQRALQIHQRLEGADVRAASAIDTLDTLASGVIVVRAGGRVLFANRIGEAILRQADGLTRVGDRLVTATPRSTRDLEALIHAASTPSTRGVVAGALRLARPSLKRSFMVLVTPLKAAAAAPFGSSACALVLVNDPDPKTRMPVDTLRALFGLTPTEATLAAELVEGHDLRHAAERMGISLNTARWHCKHVLAKTETRRQSELIRLVTSLPPRG